MIREAFRLAWHTWHAWRGRRQPEPLEHPGSDDQWGTYPRIRVADLNLQDQADADDRRSTP